MIEDDGVPFSLIFNEEEKSADCGIEEICRRKRRVLWLTVKDGRRVALKGIAEDFRTDPGEITSLRKEYLLGLRIEAEGVARVYGFEQHPQLGHVIVMEYVDGKSLNQYLGNKHGEKHNPAPLPERMKIACGIAEALAAIHNAGVTHRDLKPDNILIRSKDLTPKIIDFSHGDSEDFVMYKHSLGTDKYGAPEQQIPSEGSRASDIFSLGKILNDILPEHRFAAIRNACLSEDAESRPDIEWVVNQLQSSGKRGKKVLITVISAVILLLTLGGIAYYHESRVPTGEDTNGKVEVIPAKDSQDISDPEPPVAKPSNDPKINDNAKTQPIEDPSTATKPTNQEPVSVSSIESVDDIIEKYRKEADRINERYGNLTYDEDKNDKLRLKRGEEHFKLSDAMDKELADKGVSKMARSDAYYKLWKYILLQTNMLDGVNEWIQSHERSEHE